MRYYGIKRPKYNEDDSFISWIGFSESEAWRLFFDNHPIQNDLGTGIRAYKAIGYNCVEVEIVEKEIIK